MSDSKNNLKDKLQSLKAMKEANDIQLDTSELYVTKDEFPSNDLTTNDNYVDYDLCKENFNKIAQQTVDNIVNNYIKSEKLLNSSRLLDLKKYDIIKYARLLLMLDISERNLLMLQSNIDLGDMSKEMFDCINKAQKDLRDNMDTLDKHLAKLEKYWKEYAETYGFQNEEELIASESSNNNNEDNIHILDSSQLIETIHKKVKEQLEKEKQNKQREEEEED
jgi:hypothetical protein